MGMTKPAPTPAPPADPLHPAEPEGEPLAPSPAPPPDRPIHVPRADRWTKWKMAEFLRHLAATHSVTAAARAVGMGRQSAYKLRARLKGAPFDIAWEAAFRHAYDNLAHAALDRALNGVEVPHYHEGRLVGTSRRFDERLTVALLGMRNRFGTPMGRYGAAAEYFTERWDSLLERIETGSLSWDDEYRQLGEEELKRLHLPDEKKRMDALAIKHAPEPPRGGPRWR